MLSREVVVHLYKVFGPSDSRPPLLKLLVADLP
jgi:hypothetical protein